jgi:hypothetical protein
MPMPDADSVSMMPREPASPDRCRCPDLLRTLPDANLNRVVEVRRCPLRPASVGSLHC